MNFLENKHQEAVALAQVWGSYYPVLAVETDHWRLLLDQYTAATITKAIQRCVKKRIALKGNITLPQMLSFIESVCYKETQTSTQEAQ